jgi:hypothetical protein
VELFGTFVHLDGLCRLARGHVDGVRGAGGGGGRIFDVFRPNISEDGHRDAICRRHLVEDGNEDPTAGMPEWISQPFRRYNFLINLGEKLGRQLQRNRRTRFFHSLTDDS